MEVSNETLTVLQELELLRKIVPELVERVERLEKSFLDKKAIDVQTTQTLEPFDVEGETYEFLYPRMTIDGATIEASDLLKNEKRLGEIVKKYPSLFKNITDE